MERHSNVVNYATRGVIAPVYNVYSTDVTYVILKMMQNVYSKGDCSTC